MNTGEVEGLKQRRPTLSPFATCGDKSFECGDRQFFRNIFLLLNTQYFSQLATKVATGIIWLDTAALREREMILIKGKSTQSSRDVLSLIKNSDDRMV